MKIKIKGSVQVKENKGSVQLSIRNYFNQVLVPNMARIPDAEKQAGKYKLLKRRTRANKAPKLFSSSQISKLWNKAKKRKHNLMDTPDQQISCAENIEKTLSLNVNQEQGDFGIISALNFQENKRFRLDEGSTNLEKIDPNHNSRLVLQM